ncbi:venom serine carboxypeptidase-like [Leguminivora glycinivorella]|uniref:venom serine carboxypeptidase-like n=1 Tax=Leguminivora glycinivorella TaxID=1035111 RepID=UPI00200E9F57|nr:venom serine carboxypeptidase-like [Leguminivora glycinivorella]
MTHIPFVIFAWFSLLVCGLLQDVTGAHVPVTDDEDPGKPLFLTPYIERGDIKEARRLARVTLNNLTSYSGLFTVNKAYDSNQFFWYFPTMSSNKDKDPVVLWLQGGPGGSSMFGLFQENGPIAVQNGKIVPRIYHWALNYHLLYIDNPVGAGFSFTNNVNGLCTDETQVGEQLYSTLTQFFQLFPELQKNDFFITGESYAGKYVPALAYTIMKKNSSKSLKTNVNLKALMIGGAWINPDSQRHFVPKYHLCEGKKPMKGNEKWITNSQRKNERNNLNEDDYVSVITTNAVRKAIHVGDLSFADLNGTVYDIMKVDFCQSMAPWLSEILDHYPVTLYGGELDGTVPYDGIVDFLHNHFNFTGAEEYRSAKRYEWRVDGEPAGCVRRAKRLTEVYVLDATHFVPADQPKRSLDMLTRVTSGKGFDQKEICSVPS